MQQSTIFARIRCMHSALDLVFAFNIQLWCSEGNLALTVEKLQVLCKFHINFHFLGRTTQVHLTRVQLTRAIVVLFFVFGGYSPQ